LIQGDGRSEGVHGLAGAKALIALAALQSLEDELTDRQTGSDRHQQASRKSRAMDTARLFRSGRILAVRLPKAYRFSGTEVIAKRFGNGVLLLPIEDPWQTLEAGLAAFEPGFQLSRGQPEHQHLHPDHQRLGVCCR
jgi:antitoxin VapB